MLRMARSRRGKYSHLCLSLEHRAVMAQTLLLGLRNCRKWGAVRHLYKVGSQVMELLDLGGCVLEFIYFYVNKLFNYFVTYLRMSFVVF